MAGQFLNMLIAIVAAKYIYSKLGGTELGLIYFGLFIQLALTELLTLGIAPTITREMARSDQRSDYARDLLQFSSLLLWVLYGVFCCLLYSTLPFLANTWLMLDGVNSNLATEGFRTLLIGSLLFIPSLNLIAALDGIHKFLYSNVTNVIFAFIKNTGVLVIVTNNGDFINIATWISFSSIFRILMLYFFARRYFPLTFFLPNFHIYIVMKNWRYGLRMSSISIAAFINGQVERFIISKMLAIAVFGYYSVVLSVVMGVTIISGALSRTAYPIFVNLFEQRQIIDISKNYDIWQKIVCYTSIPFIAGIIYFNQEFFTFVFDGMISSQVRNLINWLCIGAFLHVSCFLPHAIAISCNEEKIASKVAFYNIFVTTAGAYFGIKFFGLDGAGLGYVASRVVVVFYAVPKILGRVLSKSWVVWLKDVSNVLVVSNLTFGCFWLFASVLDLGIASTLLCYMVAFILYCLISWYSLGKESKHHFENIYLNYRRGL